MISDRLSQAECAEAEELQRRIGPLFDPEDPRLTDEEAGLLMTYRNGVPRSMAMEMIAIMRGRVPGDVVGGYMTDEDAQ